MVLDAWLDDVKHEGIKLSWKAIISKVIQLHKSQNYEGNDYGNPTLHQDHMGFMDPQELRNSERKGSQ